MTHLEIAEVRLARADDDELRQCYEAQIITHAADYPSDPVLSYEVYTEQMRQPASALGPRRLWAARVDGRIAATVTAAFPEHENRHMAITSVRVPPRRRGLGSALLHATLAPARAEGRSAVTGVIKAGGDGEKWARALGFEKTAERVTQDLIIAGTDPSRWAVPAPLGFRAERWAGTAPEPLVAGYARARTAIRDAPADRSSYQDPDWTVQRVRAHEAASRDRGCELRTVVAIHEASGAVAGLTEMEMVGTSTDAANIHMIRVNHQLGYITADTICYVEAGIETLDQQVR